MHFPTPLPTPGIISLCYSNHTGRDWHTIVLIHISLFTFPNILFKPFTIFPVAVLAFFLLIYDCFRYYVCKPLIVINTLSQIWQLEVYFKHNLSADTWTEGFFKVMYLEVSTSPKRVKRKRLEILKTLHDQCHCHHYKSWQF